MSFDEVVSDLLHGCPEARGAAIVDPDGIPVVAYPSGSALEVLCAEFASILREVGQAGREFHHGALRQFSVHAERVIIILTSLAEGYFLLLVLDTGAVVGRARFLSRVAGERLYPEFA